MIRGAPPDSERLPPDTLDRLRNAFETAVERYPASDAGFVAYGGVVKSQLELLAQPDGSFMIACPVCAYRDQTWSSAKTISGAVRHVLDGPICVDELGGYAAHTALTRDKKTGKAYLIQEGIRGTMMKNDERDPKLWSDELYESALETYATTFVCGNKDIHGGNMVITTTQELVCIDHDLAKVIDYHKFTDEKWGVPDTLWPDVMRRCDTVARRILDGGLPESISPFRKDICRVNARRIFTSEYYPPD